MRFAYHWWPLLFIYAVVVTGCAPSVKFPVLEQEPTPPREAEASATTTPTATVAPSLSPSSQTLAPVPTFDGVYRKLRVPILMYHYTRVPPRNISPTQLPMSVTPSDFEGQMEWLKANNYTTVSLYDLIGALNTGTQVPAKPIVITLDDGYQDNYQNAFPILRSLGMTATFFIVTDYADKGLPDYMTWDELQDMAANGMSIELHGVQHAPMIGRTDIWLSGALQGGASSIENHLGHRPRFVAYPDGLFDRTVIAAVRDADYLGALTTRHSAYSESTRPFELPRLEVRYFFKLNWFIKLLETKD